jgi:hypothetical protein
MLIVANSRGVGAAACATSCGANPNVASAPNHPTITAATFVLMKTSRKRPSCSQTPRVDRRQ